MISRLINTIRLHSCHNLLQDDKVFTTTTFLTDSSSAINVKRRPSCILVDSKFKTWQRIIFYRKRFSTSLSLSGLGFVPQWLRNKFLRSLHLAPKQKTRVLNKYFTLFVECTLEVGEWDKRTYLICSI